MLFSILFISYPQFDYNLLRCFLGIKKPAEKYRRAGVERAKRAGCEAGWLEVADATDSPVIGVITKMD